MYHNNSHIFSVSTTIRASQELKSLLIAFKRIVSIIVKRAVIFSILMYVYIIYEEQCMATCHQSTDNKKDEYDDDCDDDHGVDDCDDDDHGDDNNDNDDDDCEDDDDL